MPISIDRDEVQRLVAEEAAHVCRSRSNRQARLRSSLAHFQRVGRRDLAGEQEGRLAQ